MTTYSFLDDYSEGAHPAILRVLAETNLAQQTPYGNDSYSIEAAARIKALLGAKSGNRHSVIRLVTSWATEEAQVDAFLSQLGTTGYLL